MIERPDWLPSMIPVDGEWNKVLVSLYSVFEKDFKQKKCKFDNIAIWWNRRILENEYYEEGFWHLITRINKKTKERLFDPRRAERLPWCAPVIANANDDNVKVWDFREGKGDIRSYLWLEELDYVVILTKRKLRFRDAIFLITAYYVDGDYQRRVLQKKYSNRVP